MSKNATYIIIFGLVGTLLNFYFFAALNEFWSGLDIIGLTYVSEANAGSYPPSGSTINLSE